MADDELLAAVRNMARDIQSLKTLLTSVVNSISAAETEVPEQMRRFVMYYHDIHDIKYIYEESGLIVPPYILREMERCDDRFRHLVEDGQHNDGGWINKVREDMTKRTGNRWDHSRLLPKETKDETGNRQQSDGQPEGGAAV